MAVCGEGGKKMEQEPMGETGIVREDGRNGRVKGDAADVVICGLKSLKIPPAGRYGVFPKYYPHSQVQYEATTIECVS